MHAPRTVLIASLLALQCAASATAESPLLAYEGLPTEASTVAFVDLTCGRSNGYVDAEQPESVADQPPTTSFEALMLAGQTAGLDTPRFPFEFTVCAPGDRHGLAVPFGASTNGASGAPRVSVVLAFCHDSGRLPLALHVNGVEVQAELQAPESGEQLVVDVSPYVREGRNVLTLMAEPTPGSSIRLAHVALGSLADDTTVHAYRALLNRQESRVVELQGRAFWALPHRNLDEVRFYELCQQDFSGEVDGELRLLDEER